MTIEASERFGLAQLHQLRGRVGRGRKQSYCLLFSQNPSQKAFRRLKSMEKNLSGAELSEIDLKMRGPGEVYGTRQHGFIKLKVASFSDLNLVRETKKWAQEITGNLSQYPLLQEKLQRDTIKNIEPN
jgi:ATP-dependent DNA helicase RecG